MSSEQELITELRSSLGKIVVALGTINKAILWVGDKGRIEWCNAAFDRLVGLRHIAILGRSLEEVLPLEEHGTPLTGKAHPGAAALDSANGFKRVYRRTGQDMYLEVEATRQHQAGEGYYAVLVITDVTHQDETEQAHLAGLALSSAANAIVITDPEGKIIWSNRAFGNLTGYQPEEVFGQTLSMLYTDHNPASVLDDMWREIRAGRPWSGQLVNRRKDGDLYTERQTVTPVCDQSGVVTNYVAIKEDISESIETNNRLNRLNRQLQAIFRAHRQYIAKEDTAVIFDGLLLALLEITDSAYGFIGEVIKDEWGTPLSLRTYAISNIAWDDMSRRFYEKNARDGLEFSNMDTLFGAAMMTGEPVISNNPDNDPRAGGRPLGHPPLNAFLGAPLIGGEGMVGLVGIANRPDGYDQEVLDFLGPFLSACAGMIESIIGDRRRAATAEQLKVSEARLRAILDAAADGIITIAQDGIIQSVNRATTRIFGYEESEMVGQNVNMIMPSPYREQHQEYIRRYLATGKPHVIGMGREVEGRRKDGLVFTMDLSVSEVKLAEGSMFTGILRDVSQRKAAEEEIKKLSLVARRTDNAVVITDVDGRIQWVNAAFERITEYTLEEVLGKKPGSVLQGEETDPEVVRYMGANLAAGKGFDVELVNYAKSGRKYWLSIEARPIRDAEGKLVNFIGVESDITRRKEAEMALAQAREREVEVGARIQQTLLFGRPPDSMESLEFAAHTLASQRIDGDFYDFYLQGPDVCDLLIGDVMGKGIPAALLGAATKNLFPLALNQLGLTGMGGPPSPEKIIGLVHSMAVRELMDLDSFVTLVYARFDMRAMKLSFVDCGHTRTLHFRPRTGRLERMAGTNMPIGFSLKDPFKEVVRGLVPGDVLVFYSDGVTEAENHEGKMWGEDALADFVAGHGGLSPAALIQAIQQEVRAFTGRESFGDDLTLVAAKVGWPGGGRPAVKQTRTFEARLDHLHLLRDFIAETLGGDTGGLDGDDLDAVLLAANEAAANVIEHAYEGRTGSDLTVEAAAFDDRWEVRLFHTGNPFLRPPPRLSPPPRDRENGYGLYLIDQLVDYHRYLHDASGRHCVLLIKTRKG